MRVGAAFRITRIKRDWRQVDVAVRARVSRALVSLIERGHLDHVSLRVLRRVAAVLEIRVDLVARARSGDLDRLLNADHSAFHEEISRFLDGLPEWIHAPEVSFSIYGERGVIDILAFHPPTGSLLIVELKTELVDVNDLLATMDRRRRLGRIIANERGWQASTVSVWVVLTEAKRARSRVRSHEATLRSAFPADGHAMRTWLRSPRGPIAALSFWSSATAPSTRRRVTVRKAPNRGCSPA